MTLQPHARRTLLLGSSLLALAVLIGAFGAHGLKSIVTPEKLVTFETGVRYHFYHGFALMMTGLIQQLLPDCRLRSAVYSFLIGILLFSFNCYFYVLSGAKVFAMIVPVGGLLFVAGWMIVSVRLLKLR